jgi:hypothetical protein
MSLDERYNALTPHRWRQPQNLTVMPIIGFARPLARVVASPTERHEIVRHAICQLTVNEMVRINQVIGAATQAMPPHLLEYLRP